GFLEPLPAIGEPPASHRAVAERIRAAWSPAQAASALPVIQLCGNEVAAKRAIAATACAMARLNLNLMPASFIPHSPADFDTLIRLWEREAVLNGSALLVDCDERETSDATRESVINRFLERTRSPLIISTRLRRRVLDRPTITLDVLKPTPSEQR